MRIIAWLTIAAVGLGVAGCDKKETPAKPSTEPAASAAGAVSAKAADVPKAPENIERLDFPGTEEGAMALVQAFLEPDADTAAMTRSLRPSTEDYGDIFVDDVLTEVRSKYEERWNEGKYEIKAKEGQTKVLMWKATTEELREGTGDSSDFPGGYKKVADKLEPGLTFYRFKFVKPDDKHGMTYDGLVFVNGHWVIVSKPYRAM
ncbi:MAG: hypothetical protein ACOC1F_00920 [Myxococcota bacterium]